MKIYVISDIHGSFDFLQKVLEKVENTKESYILILGDELYHGPRNPLPEGYNPKKTAELLNQYREKIIAIRGNCDSEVDQMMLEYPILSDYTTIFLEGKKIFATHGHIYNEDKLPKLSKGDIFIYGHTHLPVAKKVNDIYILNPGSISLPKGGNKNSYGVFENGNFFIKSLDNKIIEKINLN